jgi:hypothetical protein
LGDIARALGDYPLARQRLGAAQRVAQRIGAASLIRALQVSLAELATAERSAGPLALDAEDPHQGARQVLPAQAKLLREVLADPRTPHHVRRRAEAILAGLAE